MGKNEYSKPIPSKNKYKENLSSVGKTKGLGETSAGTLEWFPAYYCEMQMLKSSLYSKAFITRVPEKIFKKRRILKFLDDKHLKDDKGKDKKVLVEYRPSLAEIRNSEYRELLNEAIHQANFECNVPAGHIRFPQDEHNRECLKKMIAEKIPQMVYDPKITGTPVDKILVREFERALLLRSGKILTEINSGVWDFLKYHSSEDIIEVYYFDIGDISLLWGDSIQLVNNKGTASETPVKLSINGNFVLHINKVQNFLVNIVKNETEYYEGNLDEFIKPKLIQIIHSELSDTDPFDLYRNTENLLMAIKIKANDLLNHMGIEILDFNIKTLTWDEETEKIFKDRLRAIKVGGASNDHNQDLELQKLKQLKELGIDLNQYVSRDQMVKMRQQPGTIPKTSGICQYCGSPSGTGNFCQNCGKPVISEKICPKCGGIAGTGKFCQNCGSSIEIICPTCGQLAGTGKFCQNCGKSV